MISPYFLTTAFLSAEWPLKVRVRENSPNLWPTMFSDIYTGMCCLPLCTAIVRPTNSGSTVERRDQVFTGRLSLVARTASTFLSKCASTNGPFLIERAIFFYPLNLKATAHNHAAGALVATCAEALCRHTPWADRVTACRSLAFAATVRVVDRIHRHTAHGRADAAPAHRAGLADGAQTVFGITHFAQGRFAVNVHLANFAGAQTQLRIAAFTSQKLPGSTGRTRQLSTLARQHFDAVYCRAYRNVTQRQRITRLDRRFRTAHQRCADRNTFRRNDVTTLTIGIAQQSQVCAAVWIIFQTLYRRGNAIFVTLEVNQAVMLFMTTAHMTRRDVAVMVTPSSSRLLFQQCSDRLALMQAGIDDAHDGALPRGRWFQFNQCHDDYPCSLAAKLIS